MKLPDRRTITARVTEHLAHVDPEGRRLRSESDDPVGPARVTATPVARSPITLPTTSSQGGAVTLSDLSALAKVHVRATHDGPMAAALGPFGRASRDETGALVVGSGPGEWLVLYAPGTQDALMKRMEQLAGAPDEFVTVVDLTHGRAMLRLGGERARDVLAKVCAIDFSDDVVPNGSALRTSVAKLVTDLVRGPDGKTYVVNLADGEIYRLERAASPGPTPLLATVPEPSPALLALLAAAIITLFTHRPRITS